MLADTLRDQTGSLYLGFPLLPLPEETIVVDGLLISETSGLVAFVIEDSVQGSDLDGWQRVQEKQDQVYVALERDLKGHPYLMNGRELRVKIHTITVFPEPPKFSPNGQIDLNQETYIYTSVDQIKEIISKFKPMQPQLRLHVESALQAVYTLKNRAPRKSATEHPNSYGNALNKIEKEVSRLDQWQKRAAIEFPNGPQRIRGLAGSGKTIVLARKAAYLHAQNPDWTIAVTFYSRSLHQQFKELISRFYSESMNSEPDWDKLRVLHAWGGLYRDGVYTEIANSINAPVNNWLYGKSKFGADNAFAGVCNELIATASVSDINPIFDLVLIDEAQDLPPAFFQLVYLFTKEKKRIVWAYDELQRLSESSMPSVEELFGVDVNGKPKVQLQNDDDQPRQDILLKVCYRNPRESLTLAHALGLGIYRKGGQVQGFDDPKTWSEIGYDLLEGDLSAGSHVSLKRSSSSHAKFFTQLLNSQDVVEINEFEIQLEQAAWVAQSIERNIKVDLLRPDDILIVLANTYKSRNDATVYSDALMRLGIRSHLAGVTSSQDELFSSDSVAMANIHRSKGNEAAMVYVVDAQHYMAPVERISRRNALFTAITRSRAWVRISGYGPLFEELRTEVDQIMENEYALNFTLPTPDELTYMHKINRDLTANERMSYRKAEDSLREFISYMNDAQISFDTLPDDLRENLQRFFAKGYN